MTREGLDAVQSIASYSSWWSVILSLVFAQGAREMVLKDILVSQQGTAGPAVSQASQQ